MSDVQTAAATGATSAATGSTAAPAPSPANEPWYQGADQETAGYLQNRGLDKKTAKEAAFEAIKAHREAEKYIGAPAAELVRLPKEPTDQEGWNRVFGRLGVPADEKGYSFDGLKFSDGSEPDADFFDFFKSHARNYHLTPQAARDLVHDVLGYIEKHEGDDATERAGALAAEKDTLRKNWGANFSANEFIAKQAAAKSGVTPEQVDALESVVGYAKVMELFRNLGERMGEDKYVANGAPGGTGVMTVAQAKDRLSQNMRDKDWVTKLNKGDRSVYNEWKGLTTIIASGVTAAREGTNAFG